jgi:8-oxo-dGTP pyrophosphatase MutT (NUDIX family)
MTTKERRPAATILLLRDAPAFEVLMVERHSDTRVVGGALVFPGGKTDEVDADRRWLDLADGLEDAADQALRLAAIREAFEEAGVLLAREVEHRGAGRALVGQDVVEKLMTARLDVQAGKKSFLDLIEENKLVLAADALTLFARWMTPLGAPWRFDTYFFLAQAPAGQFGAIDGHEAVDITWLAPETALRYAEDGTRKIVFPTQRNLEMLGRSDSSTAAIEAARTREIKLVEPRLVKEDDGTWLILPEDSGYAVTRQKVNREF